LKESPAVRISTYVVAIHAVRSDLEFQQQIIGIVGHDLRNPLTTIAGSISMLRRQDGLTPSSVATLDRAARICGP
jgi:signal transduction histidine kinase